MYIGSTSAIVTYIYIGSSVHSQLQLYMYSQLQTPIYRAIYRYTEIVIPLYTFNQKLNTPKMNRIHKSPCFTYTPLVSFNIHTSSQLQHTHQPCYPDDPKTLCIYDPKTLAAVWQSGILAKWLAGGRSKFNLVKIKNKSCNSEKYMYNNI